MERETNDQTEKSSRRRGGCLFFILRWTVRGVGLLVLAVILFTVFNMLRSLDVPQALRDAPATGPAASPDQATTVTLTVVSPTTGTTGTASIAPDPSARDGIIAADLIPLDAITDPAKKAKAAEINALYHRWVELLTIYETDPTAYTALPAERRQPFDDGIAYWGYREIADRMKGAGFGAAEERAWNDRFLRCLADHRDWEAASEHALKHQKFNNLLDALYYARRCRGTIGPSRVAVYPLMYLLIKYIDRQRNPTEQTAP